MPTRSRSASAPCYLFLRGRRKRGCFGMSYIIRILITTYALWGMLSYIHYLFFKNFRVDRPKRFQSVTCGCLFFFVFFFNKNRDKGSAFSKISGYIWTGSQIRVAWFYSTGVVKENTAVPQTLPIMFCTYPGVPYKIAMLIYNWAPLIKLDQNEVWRPSGVEHFFSNTKLEGCSDQPDPSSLTGSNLERCNTNSYLNTKESLSCPSCTECFSSWPTPKERAIKRHLSRA